MTVAATRLDFRIPTLLEKSSAMHSHLCPRQVLGVRLGLLAGEVLGLDFPRTDKRVMVFVETDGCFADGVSVASGCWLGRRTMRLMDYGKIAATFVDTKTGQTVRIIPQLDLRRRAKGQRKEGQKRWAAYLETYQTMSDHELFTVQEVELAVDLKALISVHGKRVVCEACGEEVINEREVTPFEQVLCRSCAGGGYFKFLVSVQDN